MKKKEKQISTNELARMVVEGFRSVDRRFDEMRLQTKEGFDAVYAELDGLKEEVRQSRFAVRIEYAALLDRIEKLEQWKRSVELKKH